MKRILKILGEVLVVLLVLAIVFQIGWFVGKSANEKAIEVVEDTKPQTDLKLPFEKEKRIVTVDEIEVKLSPISEFSTYAETYRVKKSADFARYIDDFQLPGTTNVINFECEGIVKVGYDIDEIQVSVDDENGKIHVTIPKARVLDNHIIWDSVDCEEVNNILNPIKFNQYKTIISEIEAEGLAKAEEQGIYKSAEKNLKVLITNFLSVFDDYRVVFD